MNLISCKSCGIVLDKDRLTFPDIHTESDDYNEAHSEWNGRDYVPFIKCPLCDNRILEKED